MNYQNGLLQQATLPQAQLIEYCLYARKSSEDDERQAMSTFLRLKSPSETRVFDSGGEGGY